MSVRLCSDQYKVSVNAALASADWAEALPNAESQQVVAAVTLILLDSSGTGLLM